MELDLTYLNLNQLGLLWQSTVGIERESLRVDTDGYISKHPHSDQWGSRSHQPYIQTDFAESQLELITPPELEASTLLNWLSAQHQIVATTNEEQGDLMWPFSTPAIIPTNTDNIKIAQLEIQAEYNYRAYLAKIYGKHVQLLSGIHFNFQINPTVLQLAFNEQDDYSDFTAFSNKMYMHLGRNYMRYRWFLTYLIGASPYIAPNYNTNLYGKPHRNRMRSIRQSHYGYQNKESVVMNYDSLEDFVDTLEEAVDTGALSLEKELYRDVRFRGGASSRDLLNNGVGYLELRNIDLNPYEPYGINAETINLIRLFLISLLYIEDVSTDVEIALGNEMNYAVSEADALDDCLYPAEAEQLLKIMTQVGEQLELAGQGSFKDTLAKVTNMVVNPSLTLAGRIVTDAPDYDAYLEMGLRLAAEHQEVYLAEPYLMHGFTHMELSTQDVMKEAMKAGIAFEIIDDQENLLRLQYEDHVEYVRNANMTSLDTLISYYLMENKVATKLLLERGGLVVPQGDSFNSLEDALLAYPTLPDRAQVVKPKNTNYGLGISIFKEKPSYTDFKTALEVAFDEDSTVLVEAYIPGTELRFYVQNGSTVAVVERQPAHVVGDGKSTISALIDEVNQHPLRGQNHLTPLTEIEQGRIEELQLKNQGLSFNSIPEKEQVVFLRENSNVSTGGISIDRTDDVHPAYKEIAERSAELLEANFCGVDIIMQDFKQAPDETNYGIIEANFNPSILIHRFPGQGTPRLLGKAVLEQLFPEAFNK